MAVSIKQVRSALEPDEVDYTQAARLGADALPHLHALIRGPDPMLASKAAYLAGLIADERSTAVVQEAASRREPVIRIAAATGAGHLPPSAASSVLLSLLNDADVGVRRAAIDSIPPNATPAVRSTLEKIVRMDPDPSLRDRGAKLLLRLSRP